MVLIKKKQSDTPAILLDKGADAIEALKSMTVAERLKYKYDSAVYGGPTVKDKLKTLQSDKCCFCEGNVSALSHGDVEHYRPKAGWRQIEKEKLVKPGYYWLAYDFSNLFLSCQICNQTNKKNYFPIAKGSVRCLLHTGDLGKEEPLIINPGGKVDPAKYLTFHGEMAVAINLST